MTKFPKFSLAVIFIFGCRKELDLEKEMLS